MNTKHKKSEDNYDAVITIRTSATKKKEFKEKAKLCRLPMSEYGRRILDGEHPKAALNDDERALLLDVIAVKNHLTLYANALEGATKNMSATERKNYMLCDKTMQERAAIMDTVIDYISSIINKHLKR